MAKILYVETNFAIGIAKGHDPDGERFLSGDPAPIRLVIPGLCFIEAFSAWNLEEKQRKKFLEQLASHAREVGRDRTSARARALFGHLQQSKNESEELINDTAIRSDLSSKRFRRWPRSSSFAARPSGKHWRRVSSTTRPIT